MARRIKMFLLFVTIASIKSTNALHVENWDLLMSYLTLRYGILYISWSSYLLKLCVNDILLAMHILF